LGEKIVRMRDDLLIKKGFLIISNTVLECDLLIKSGKIVEIGPNLQIRRGKVIEAEGLYVSPGFIDTHVNGGGGRSFMECTEEAFKVVINFHLRHGTTALLPTAVAAPLSQMREFLKLVSNFQKNNPVVLGAHLNGPFVSSRRCGAMNPKFILKPSMARFQQLVSGVESAVKVITLAPEEDGSEALIDAILKLGAIPSLGHSNATYDDAMRSINHNVRHFTHLFNAMREFHHREPGAVGAALDSDGVTMELIVDGIHIHPAIVRLLVKVKELDSIVLVTDAISAAGMSDGHYSLGGLEVSVKGGVARLADGTLAGSTLTMERAVKNFMEFTGLPLPEAVRAATLNPARLLGLEGRKGSITEGKDADLVVFDEAFNVHYTIIGGEIVFSKDEGHRRG
jgi:N-acetylglucosamine-6-phosphate deacetylase